MKVRNLMTSGVTTAVPEATMEEIAAIMRDQDTGAVPVVDGDELLGIVTDRDIVLRCIAEGKVASETVARDVMSSDLESIDADSDLEKASDLMAYRQIRRLPVVEKGRLAGIISLGDVAVKQHQRPEDQAGMALRQISQGVKKEKPGAAGKKTSSSPKQAKQLNAHMATQGIANRNVPEEQQRQSRVIPFREQGKRTPRRKTG